MILPDTEPDAVPSLLDRVEGRAGAHARAPPSSRSARPSVPTTPTRSTRCTAWPTRVSTKRRKPGERPHSRRPRARAAQAARRARRGLRRTRRPAHRAAPRRAGRRASEGSLPVAATRIAARHADRPVAVEVVRWRDAPQSPRSRPRQRRRTPAAPRHRRRRRPPPSRRGAGRVDRAACACSRCSRSPTPTSSRCT